MKMVVDCRSTKTYEQYLLAEYLVYKIYNILTPYSFRVRLIRVNYIDSGAKKQKPNIAYAFAIENQEELARRMGGMVLDRQGLLTLPMLYQTRLYP